MILWIVLYSEEPSYFQIQKDPDVYGANYDNWDKELEEHREHSVPVKKKHCWILL